MLHGIVSNLNEAYERKVWLCVVDKRSSKKSARCSEDEDLANPAHAKFACNSARAKPTL